MPPKPRKPTVAPKKPQPAAPKDANLIVRIPAALRDKFSKTCAKAGLSMSSAIRGFIIRQIG